MADLKGQLGEVRMTVHVTRKATGKVDTFDLIGRVVSGEQKESKETEDGGNAQHRGS